MDQTKAETADLETLEERNNPLPRIGQAGSSERTAAQGGRRKKSLAYGRLTCDQSRPKQRFLAKLRAEGIY